MSMANRKLLIMTALALLLAALQPLALVQAASAHVVVNAYRLNVRSGPGIGHSVIATVAGGTVLPVTMLSYDRDWYEVSSAAGAGWVHRRYAVDRGDWSAVPWAGQPANTGSGAGIPAGSPHVVVNTSYLNARSGPGLGHAVLTVLPGGTTLLVTAIDQAGRWYQVETSAGSGWVNASYTAIRGNLAGVARIGGPVAPTSPSTPGQPGIPAGAAHLVVNTSYLNVRSGPGLGHGVILTVPGGTALEALSVYADGRWYQVNTSAGPGWVNSAYTLGRGNFSALPRTYAPDPWAGGKPHVVVNSSRLNIRSAAGLGDNVITSVPGGTELAVTGATRDQRWFQVSGGFGQGWLRSSYTVFRGDISQVPVIG